MTRYPEPPCSFVAVPHFPKFYRYRVALPAEQRAMWNRYGTAVIGLAIVLGKFAYCIKWADAKVAP